MSALNARHSSAVISGTSSTLACTESALVNDERVLRARSPSAAARSVRRGRGRSTGPSARSHAAAVHAAPAPRYPTRRGRASSRSGEGLRRAVNVDREPIGRGRVRLVAHDFDCLRQQRAAGEQLVLAQRCRERGRLRIARAHPSDQPFELLHTIALAHGADPRNTTGRATLTASKAVRRRPRRSGGRSLAALPDAELGADCPRMDPRRAGEASKSAIARNSRASVRLFAAAEQPPLDNGTTRSRDLP